MKLVNWPLMDGPFHLVATGRRWRLGRAAARRGPSSSRHASVY